MTLLEIFGGMLLIGKSLEGKTLTPPELTKVIRRLIGSDDITVKSHRDKNADYNQVIIGGAYDPHEDEAGYPSITIYVTYSPDQKTILVDDIDWERLCIDLIECSGHEMIHQEQYRARDFDVGPHIFVSGSLDMKKKEEQEYLGNPDEIDAYGFSIAVEAYLTVRPKKLASKHLLKNIMYRAYAAAFGTQHSITRTLILTTCKYYYQLYTGANYAK
jgi:hypothetical protein